jgi:hypothetical protein
VRTIRRRDLLEAQGAIELIEKPDTSAEKVRREMDEDLVAESRLQRLLPG